MLTSGLTLIFSMMGVLNFAHASVFMLGAYFSYQFGRCVGFWPALVIAPLAVRPDRRGDRGATACAASTKAGTSPRSCSRSASPIVIEELVTMIWGRNAVANSVPGGDRLLAVHALFGTSFPAYKGLMMAISVAHVRVPLPGASSGRASASSSRRR